MRRVSILLWTAVIGVVSIGVVRTQTPPAGRGGAPVPGGRGVRHPCRKNTCCRGKIEMSYLGKVEMSYCPHEKAAIPSINIVLHRGQPSRLPSGAKAGGLDGARPRRDKNS